ncbi:hypothetical protein N7454_002863 [Penicillium verhagenii]|nr:hypothetical protein N7454_002863 [Penicillium verhagenii]
MTKQERESIVINVEARAIKLEHCGSKRSLRNLRKCNESRFKRSELKPRKAKDQSGTFKVPIQFSRRISDASPLHS